MLSLKNDVSSFEELFAKKGRVVLYGAGAAAKIILQEYYTVFPRESVAYIIDGNGHLDGAYCTVNEDVRVKIISLKHFCEIWGADVRQFTFLLTPYYSLFVIKELDRIEALDGVEAYVYPFIVDKMPKAEFSLKNTDKPLIPRVIHYFWIGQTPMPEEYQKNIESWRRFCPDYEIIQWNESNYDFTKFRYAREALECRKYEYVTDVARKDVLYTYGGIYFDTDVELLRPLDELLYNEAFIGIDDGGQVNSGSGLGAVQHNIMIGEMLELYRDLCFTREDGGLNLFYNSFYETRLMIEKGFRISDRYQRIHTMGCFPRTVLYPEGVAGVCSDYTEKTIANHKINPYDRSEVAAVRERLLGADAFSIV